MNRLLFLYLLLFFFSCKEKKSFTYECEQRDANLRLSISELYPGEKIELFYNNNLFYSEESNTSKSHFLRWFCMPTNQNIQIKLVTIYKGHIYLNYLSSTIRIRKDSKYALIIGMPYPKNLKNITFPPEWSSVPIDSSKRNIVLEKDTAWFGIDY